MGHYFLDIVVSGPYYLEGRIRIWSNFNRIHASDTSVADPAPFLTFRRIQPYRKHIKIVIKNFVRLNQYFQYLCSSKSGDKKL